MTKVKNDYTINDINEEVSKYLEAKGLIEKGYNYANNLLKDDSLNLLNVAYILTTLQADEETFVFT